MTPGDSKHWLRTARAIARDRSNAAGAVAALCETIADRLNRGEPITDVVTAWDSLSRNPHDPDATNVLFVALDTGTARMKMASGTAIGLGIVFTIQFKEDFSFQLSDNVLLTSDTVACVAGNVFRGSLGKPVFASRLIQLLQVEVAMLTPTRLGRNLRTAVRQSQGSPGLETAVDFVPPWPEGVLQIVDSKPDLRQPYVIFTAVLPGYLWFEGNAGDAEIEQVWMSSGRLRNEYDFAELDQICARVHSDLSSEFDSLVSTKMNPVPLRLMTAGEAFSRREPSVRATQRSALRTLGYY